MVSSVFRHGRYTVVVILIVVLIPALVLGLGRSDRTFRKPDTYANPVPLRVAGLLGKGSGEYATVSPEEVQGASYLSGSAVLRLPDGRLRYVPPGAKEPVTVDSEDPGARAASEESRAWLERGTVPGRTREERRMAERALLDLRLLTQPNGAALAAPTRGWHYVWPRDASWTAAAFAATGHREESYRILRFLAEAQEDDGGWEARYRADGAPVLDGRPAQLDAVGWFPWAVWYWSRDAGGERSAGARTRALWPAVRAASDTASASLGPDGLPPGGPDYWETATWRPNLGTAAPLRTGLRAAASLADELGHPEDARRYANAAARLDLAIDREFAPHGYPRTTDPGSGADAAITFLAPPFAPFEPEVNRAVERAEERLAVPNGGLLPGENWPQDPTVAWTPETALFALSAAASGDEERAGRHLGWLMDHRTSLGAFPEKVNGEGEPRAAAPLGWTSAAVLLALAAEEEPLPVPPAGSAVEDEGTSPLGSSFGGALIGAGALVAATRARWRPQSGSSRPSKPGRRYLPGP
ncbi:MAG TPA: glycoside hydrolase family 15 protein [Rubrobacteraceae bacterium]|nr:glycoside hydrolase family 15 protein [Rubrobacteraceae bacterium]